MTQANGGTVAIHEGRGGPEAVPPNGAQLRLARQARGLSQQQLAGVAGVTRQAVSAVESGHSDPSLRVALALARALGMTVEDLFGPGDPADPVLARPVAATPLSRCRCTRIRRPGRGSAPRAA
jgi:DNA-binding XRE family transcriptional regulator